MSKLSIVSLLLASLSFSGVLAVDASASTPSVELIRGELSLGCTGEDVQALQGYLSRYGYLANEELASLYPNWSPPVKREPESGVFDRATEKAVRLLQRQSGLDVTGAVDVETRELLQQPRCGVPDLTRDDSKRRGHRIQVFVVARPSEEGFIIGGSPWNTHKLTWRVTNTNDVTLAQARGAVTNSLYSWAFPSDITFVETTSGENLTVTFASIDGIGNVVARTHYPSSGGDMKIDTAETWSVATPTPAGKLDLQTVVVHEFGHALGIGHSSIKGAVMYPTVSSGTMRRSLTADDEIAAQILYLRWRWVGALNATDVGVGGTTWVVSGTPVSGGYSIYARDPYYPHAWRSSGGGARRISVQENGRPWIVNSSGAIFRRTSTNATSGSWQKMPGCAKDIGVSPRAIGFEEASVWVIGCTAVAGGYSIHAWVNGAWVRASGGAVRIAVGPTGVPWVVNSSGNIYRRTSTSPTSGSWELLSGTATDISVDNNGFAWITGTDAVAGGHSIFVWNQQAAGPTADTVAKKGWVKVASGGAVNISVGGVGAWLTNDGNRLYMEQCTLPYTNGCPYLD